MLNYYYISIGAAAVFLGIMIARLDFKNFKSSRDKENASFLLFIILAIIESPGILGLILAFFGFLTVLKGFGAI